MDERTYKSLRRLLSYCGQEEKEDYEARPSTIHIYRDIERLQEWVDEVAKYYPTNN